VRLMLSCAILKICDFIKWNVAEADSS